MRALILAAAFAAFAGPAYAADVALSQVQVAAQSLGNTTKTNVGNFVSEVKNTGGLGTTTNAGVTALGVSANQQITGSVNMIISGPTFPNFPIH